MNKQWLASVGFFFISCLRPSQDRAERDLEVGLAEQQRCIEVVVPLH